MASSLLNSFVGGTRQVLAAQLVISVGAVGLAGWTLGVTNELIRERERLRERVIQLEQTIADRGDVVPGAVTTVERQPANENPVYPGAISENPVTVTPEPAPEGGVTATVEETRGQEAPTASQPPAEPAPSQSADAEAERGIGRVIAELFTPPPAMSRVVLHARNEADAEQARRVASLMSQTTNLNIVIEVMPPRDPRQSGYAYFDGRQGRAAAQLVQQFHDSARRMQIATWSAQLRGIALPAQGEYTAERLDIVLPPLPAAAQPGSTAIDPRRLQAAPNIVRSPPPPPPPIR